MSQNSSAEARYREAFTRLKEGRPEVLVAGTQVSQNNVALEAGKHPSALRKERFSDLIVEIQKYCQEMATKAISTATPSKRDEISELKTTIALLKKRQELEASRVLSLLMEVTSLRKELAVKNASQAAVVAQITRNGGDQRKS